MRAALYARYSSELQNPRSAEDQLALMREAVARRGWTEVAAWKDEEISGASMYDRAGVKAMLAAGREQQFDVLVVEDLDRLARDLEDVAHVFKRLTFAGVVMETLTQGRVTLMHVSIGGLMSQMFLEGLGFKVRRGLREKVLAGQSGGGLCFGYRIVEVGRLEIDQDQAQIVREIFRRYAAGESPRAIAGDLNARAVPGPRGHGWTASAINGDRRVGDGILHQELYIGIRVWNRRKFRKHPDTGRRSSVINPQSEWIRTEAPELRILDDAAWLAVQDRKAAISTLTEDGARVHQARRPKRLLSGLVRCASCGGPMILSGDRYACSAHRERGECRNGRTAPAAALEARVVIGVRDRLLAADVVADAVRTYRDDMAAAQAQALRERAPMERELAELSRRIERLQDGYERGVYELEELKARITPLKARRVDVLALLEKADAPPAAAVQLHPRAVDHYKDMVGQLADAIQDDDAGDVRDAFRKLVDKVVLTPGQKRGQYEIRVHSKLTALLGVSERAASQSRTSASEVMVGAGVGFEPTTFRL